MKNMTLEHKQDQRPKRPYRPRKIKTTPYDEEDVPEIVFVPKPVNWGEGLRLRPGQGVDLGRWHDEQMEALSVKTNGTSVFEVSSQVDTLSPEKRRAILQDNSKL